MLMSVKGTQTEQNLLKAFAGESQAANRYDYFAKIAKNEGYVQIAELFTETADNERQHAKQFFKHMEGGMVEITATYPAGILSTTADNLLASADGELEEWGELYPDFAGVARKEGFDKVAESFEAIMEAEKAHEARFRALYEKVVNKTVFVREDEQEWKCGNCGWVTKGTTPPDLCPACAHPKSHFRIKDTNY
ncbi:MAG: ferritin family protein [Bacillota bacterium]|nr:ferritin family protein [Bacillota bacterium]MDW7677589.1 ferritin family protein [Bacillota bacterium]